MIIKAFEIYTPVLLYMPFEFRIMMYIPKTNKKYTKWTSNRLYANTCELFIIKDWKASNYVEPHMESLFGGIFPFKLSTTGLVIYSLVVLIPMVIGYRLNECRS